MKEILLTSIVQKAYKFSSGKIFVLSSGETSNEYINCKTILSYPKIFVPLGIEIFSLIKRPVSAVGGMTAGADPIAISASYASYLCGTPMNWFSVRKEPKTHGECQLIDGDISRGESVVIVEDVVTTGASTIKAIKTCLEFDLEITQVIALIDREQDGMENIRNEVGPNVSVQALFTRGDIYRKYVEEIGSDI